MSSVVPLDDCRVFYDGTTTEPRLLHPEGVAVDHHGDIWCGGELGQIYRISADGSRLEERASTGGFTLGVAFDIRGILYTCDLKHKAIFRFNPSTGDLTEFARGNDHHALTTPNWPVVDTRRNALYVSDSVANGPGIWRFDLSSGQGELWYTQPLVFANGMALSAQGDAILVAETFANRISHIPIQPDGTPGQRTTLVETGDALPDGLALDSSGNLYIACYEPSQILRLRSNGVLEVFVSDPQAHTLCHPTNCAFRGSQMFIANLGRWHITTVETGSPGLVLPISIPD
jgi:sugar lactone lactonase YvrE